MARPHGRIKTARIFVDFQSEVYLAMVLQDAPVEKIIRGAGSGPGQQWGSPRFPPQGPLGHGRWARVTADLAVINGNPAAIVDVFKQEVRTAMKRNIRESLERDRH